MSNKESNSNINKIIKILKEEYPNAKCSLIYKHPYQLLIAGRLSSQCTDKRVNIVTKILFDKYQTINSFANADIYDIQTIIKPCGLFNVKANNIIEMCKVIINDFNGKIPNTIDKLIQLPGIGRKTANLIMGEIFKKPAIICDTHCIRITNLLGLSSSKNPTKVENELKQILPPKDSCLFCHLMVYHGREICKARSPLCNKCVIKDFCKFNKDCILRYKEV